jgi:CBS domain-containing protein
MTRATLYAVTVGKVSGYILIVLGIIEAVAVNLIGGLWLAIIGWFLRNAAVMSYRQHLLHEVLEHVQAKEAMTPNPTTVPPDLTLKQLMDEHFLREHFQAYPVVRDEHPVGLITREQVRAVPSDQWSARHVDEVMARAPDGITVSPDEPMTQVLEKMESSGIERVLVTHDDHLEGIITVADLTVWLRRAQEMQPRRGAPWWLGGRRAGATPGRQAPNPASGPQVGNGDGPGSHDAAGRRGQAEQSGQPERRGEPERRGGPGQHGELGKWNGPDRRQGSDRRQGRGGGAGPSLPGPPA